SPGVYLFRDAKTNVIYVGKALRLRDRLSSYFTPGYAETARVSELIRRATDFEFVTTANEVEALVLENNLIKNYRPRFNIRLKDDKNYLYLKLPVTEEFPRVHYSRRVQNDGARYFGPYTSAQSLRSTVKSIRQLLPFRTCSDEIFKQGKVCLDFHIRRCPGPCEKRISPEDYRARIREVALFMEGRSDVLVRQLEGRMEDAADRLDFENAARYRDQLHSIERIAVPQRGRKRALVMQLGETAAQELEQLRIQADYDRSRTEPMLAALADALGLEEPPKRIECYDISNIQGDSAVGAMVVFEDGRPRNDHYRHFKIKFVPGPNDFAMLQEVLRRRLERLESSQRREDAEVVGDRSSTSRPDPLLIDGGKGQLGAALEVLEAAGFADIPTFSLAK